MGNAKSVKLVLLILFGLTGIAHGAPDIYLRPVFENRPMEFSTKIKKSISGLNSITG